MRQKGLIVLSSPELKRLQQVRRAPRMALNMARWARKEGSAWLWFTYHEALRRKGQHERDFCQNYILSYPRSGNHAVRFAVEVLSERPTLGAGDHESFSLPRGRFGIPIFLRTPEISISSPLPRPAAVKRHRLYSFDIVDKLIFVERDVVEAVLSEEGERGSEHELKDAVRWWKSLQDDFDRFPENRRLLIRFEEILNGEVRWIENLIDFLELEVSGDEALKLQSRMEKGKDVLRRPARTTSAGMYANRFPEKAAFVADFAAEIGAVRHS